MSKYKIDEIKYANGRVAYNISKQIGFIGGRCSLIEWEELQEEFSSVDAAENFINKIKKTEISSRKQIKIIE